jgi:ribose transport system substrate-binding protein
MKAGSKWGRAFAGCACVTALLVVAACGSSSPSGSSGQRSSPSSGSGGTDRVKAAAQALVTPYLRPPAKIDVTVPVPGKIPANKTIDYIDCGLPSCAQYAVGFAAAFRALHWKLVTIQGGATPQAITAGFNQAVQNKPNGVIAIAFSKALVQPQLAQLQKEHIPVITCCVTDPVGQGLTWIESGPLAAEMTGGMAANWVLADKGSNANVVWMQVPAYPIVAYFEKGFKEEYKKLCPSCQYGDVGLSSSDLGTPSATTKIVGYLQAHPSVNYVAVAAADFVVGLPAAIDAAGLRGKVSIVSASTPDPQAVQALKQHDDWTGLVSWYPEFTYKIADVFARIFVGASTAPDEGIYPRYYVTAETAASIKNYNTPINPNAPKQFAALWHVG